MSHYPHPPISSAKWPESLSPRDRLGALRIIDANYNRASEGLRVVEEYCRFLLGDHFLTSQCKHLRHDLAEALAVIPQAGLSAARDTQGDVGTTVTASQEQTRGSLRDVVTANWRRVEQALRAIEEYAKVLQLERAQRIEQLRYQAYTLAKACDITSASRDLLEHARLYVLIDGGNSQAQFEASVEVLIAAGVQVIQLRDKRLDDRTLLDRARSLSQIVRESDRQAAVTTPHTRQPRPLVIINDRPDIAVLAQADGVHIGQDELKLADARGIVGPDMLIGVSTHTLQQARQAVLDGANYLGCGPTFHSDTKDFAQLAGLEFLSEVFGEISLPAFAIGGITDENLPQVLATGFTRIAVSGAISTAADPTREAQQLLALLG
jgi:thiamine-phosphate pyrophosphorylase